ncbi:MAG TPA: hypothetical protein VLR46_12455 [Candidatus Dormibacteraeota bacterium]|nr:hypothetical protein [Candidatus Dormibacteraeota bacterium]
MYSINPEHAMGLVGGAIALAVALVALRFHPRRRSVPGTVQAAAVLMAVSGGVHLALVRHHVATEPLTALLFVLNGLAFIVLAASFTWRWWRLASAGLLITTVLAYLVYVGAGFEGPDQVGIATKLIEVTALGLVLVPVRGEAGRPHRSWRWASLGVAMPLLIVITGATVWIVDLARPDARHVHAGALLQSTNTFATPVQVDAANRLYQETKVANQPFEDWHQAWAAGYRPGGSTTLPSTHWMNQRFVDAGYVMDPHHPQGLVYANTHHGPVLLGVMFQMKGLNQFGPDPGGPMTAWHQHENICFTPFGFEFSLMTPYSTCPIGAIDISAPPMLHVWVVDNPRGGPFAVDIDPSVVTALDRT